MTSKKILDATKSDTDAINGVEPPTRGVDVGGGIHVAIPIDWAARVANGEDVPGCTYAKPQADGALIVDDFAQAELAKPGKDPTNILARLVATTNISQQTDEKTA